MADHEQMATGPPDPPERRVTPGKRDSQEKAGAFIVRVWLQESADPKLRIRLVGRLDLEADDRVTAVATDVDEMLGHLRGWVERFVDPGSG